MSGLNPFRFLKPGHVALALALSFRPVGAQQQNPKLLVYGIELDSEAFKDSLARPFWRALSEMPCASPNWSLQASSPSALAASTAPLLKRLRQAVGPPMPSAGSILERVTVFRGPRYTVERVLITSRVPGATSFAYVVRQGITPIARKTAAIILLHGSGMQPVEAFGWDVNNSYHANERSKNAAFIAAALEFAEAGYTVYVPWMADNADSPAWQELPWATLERNGAALRPRIKGLGPLTFLVNEVSAGVDYLSSLPDVDASKLAIVGWGEGSQIAAMSGALDQRFAAVVRLSPPIDRQALREAADGVLMLAHLTHIDCALGDREMAALIAPRPLLYAYSTKDESVARLARFVSLKIASGIRELYAALGVASNYRLQADTSWSSGDSRRVRTWVDAALRFQPRLVTDTIEVRQPTSTPSDAAWIDSTRVGRQGYAARLGTCVARSPRPDLGSVSAFLRSVEPFRRGLARDLGIPTQSGVASVSVLRRTPVARRSGYSLDFVQIRSSRTNMPISGLLAVPDGGPKKGLPAVVSADGDAGLGTPFGLFGRERVPYLNAYADALASAGTVVFVPYYPFEFPEIAAAETAARTNGGQTSFTYTVPLFSAAADFLLSLPEVDSTKIGIWGISFAGVAALYTAAIDTRFGSVVFSDPVVTADVLFGTLTSSSLVAWWPEICHTVDAVQAYLIAPRRFVRENGLRDANGYERSPLESVARIRNVYDSLGVGSEFILVRHSGGHETRPREVRPLLPQ